MNWKRRTMRYEEGFWLPDGSPEKARLIEQNRLKFRFAVFVSTLGFIMGWACNR